MKKNTKVVVVDVYKTDRLTAVTKTYQDGSQVVTCTGPLADLIAGVKK